MRKPFEQHLYDKHDNPAKEKLVELLEREGHTIRNVSENYYADVVSEKGGMTVYSEAEVKTAWKDTWPETWSEIRIPERKKRLLDKYDSNVNFYVFNSNLSQCWLIRGSQMTDEKLKPAFGRQIRKGEKFFHIDYTEAELVVV